MINRFFKWYGSTPLLWRRLIISILVPVMEYVLLDPCRWALNAATKISPTLSIALLPVLLVVAVLTAVIVSMFVIEFSIGIVSKIQNKFFKLFVFMCVFGWAVGLFYLIN